MEHKVKTSLIKQFCNTRKSIVLGLLIGLLQVTPSFANNTGENRSAEIKQQAEQGLAEAQYILGNMYAQGFHVEKDLNKAFSWVKKSAEQGYAAAEFDLASMYDAGEGVDKNLQKAASWYKKVAEKGEAAAAYNLANMYETGEGLPEDLLSSYAWFEAAALMGFEDAKEASSRIAHQFDKTALAKAEKQATDLINSLRESK